MNLLPREYMTELIYRSSEDGISADAYHSHCDDKGESLIIAKTEENKILGGYTDIP